MERISPGAAGGRQEHGHGFSGHWRCHLCGLFYLHSQDSGHDLPSLIKRFG